LLRNLLSAADYCGFTQVAPEELAARIPESDLRMIEKAAAFLTRLAEAMRHTKAAIAEMEIIDRAIAIRCCWKLR
jgi:hypothetical protein